MSDELAASDDRVFTLSRANMRAHHRNAVLGLALAVALCALASWGYGAESANPNAALVVSVFLVMGLFGAFSIGGHVRYVWRGRSHRLEVGGDHLRFTTRGGVSVLRVADVGRVERLERMWEGPSLLMTLRNGRYVRLAGYEDQERLIALVTERVRGAQ